MSKEDKIKAQIDWLKVTFLSSIAIIVSLVSWLANNADQPEKTLWTVLAAIALLAMFVAVVLINRLALKKMDELEEL